MSEAEFHLFNECAPDVCWTFGIDCAKRSYHVVTPSLDGSFCFVRSFIAGRHNLELYFAFGEMVFQRFAGFFVKNDVAYEVFGFDKESERICVSFDV